VEPVGAPDFSPAEEVNLNAHVECRERFSPKAIESPRPGVCRGQPHEAWVRVENDGAPSTMAAALRRSSLAIRIDAFCDQASPLVQRKKAARSDSIDAVIERTPVLAASLVAVTHSYCSGSDGPCERNVGSHRATGMQRFAESRVHGEARSTRWPCPQPRRSMEKHVTTRRTAGR